MASNDLNNIFNEMNGEINDVDIEMSQIQIEGVEEAVGDLDVSLGNDMLGQELDEMDKIMSQMNDPTIYDDNVILAGDIIAEAEVDESQQQYYDFH